jgi:hypothetical protein
MVKGNYMLFMFIRRQGIDDHFLLNDKFYDENIKRRISATIKWVGDHVSVVFMIRNLLLTDSNTYVLKNNKSGEVLTRALAVYCEYA